MLGGSRCTTDTPSALRDHKDIADPILVCRDSPLRPPSDRVLQIGDASGVQSPLSFGGFGAMTRHLARLTTSVREALQVGTSPQGTAFGKGALRESAELRVPPCTELAWVAHLMLGSLTDNI